MTTNYDPMIELPLDNETETLITMATPRLYLSGLLGKLEGIPGLKGLSLDRDVSELTDEECRKVLRAILRNAKDYKGPEMCQ